MVTDGQRIEKKGRARKKEVFAQLVEAAQRLVAVAMACKEQSQPAAAAVHVRDRASDRYLEGLRKTGRRKTMQLPVSLKEANFTF